MSLATIYPIDAAVGASAAVKHIYRSAIQTRIARISVTDWAEAKRVIPEGQGPKPGPFRWSETPYMREIADCLSEMSPVRKVAVMKGAQIAYTTAILENMIGYVIDAAPGPMLFMTGDAEMAKQSGGRRIDGVIQGAGLSDRIYATSAGGRSRKTGDTATEKQFAGGFLRLVGAGSGAKLRSDSVRYLLCDEVDAYKQIVGGTEKDSKHAREGDPISLAERRTDAYEQTRKVVYGSTPLLDHSSKIKELFLSGDQRRYHVPCKHCGEYQYLKWSQMKWETDEDSGQLVWDSVHYECEHCGGAWRNEDKVRFLAAGEWRATAQPSERGFRSYHISSLYSPVGFRSWESGVQEFLKAKDDPQKLQTFVNTFLGETWADEQERPKIEVIMTRERDYHVYTLPDTAKPLLITVGADVQGDRIEAEIVAWGRDFESWSVAYEVMPGDTAEIEAECWQHLRELITSEYAELPVALAGIDSGYRTDVVYEFADSFESGVHAVMGSDAMARDKQYIKPYTVTGRSTPRIDINTGVMKQQIYRYLNRAPIDGESQRSGYCHFPAEYNRQHFLQLTAEVMVKDRFGRVKWDAGERRNEQLDCFDDSTEVLTDSGWKLFSDLDRSELVATVDIDTERIEYQNPIAYIDKPYDGEMIHMQGRTIDIMVTPGHRMVACKKRQEKQSDGTRKWNLDPPMEIVKAEDLSIHHQLLRSASWDQDYRPTVTIPAFISKDGRTIWPAVEVDSQDFAELLGWFVSEGSSSKHNAATQPGSVRRRVQFDQNPGHKCDRLRELLGRLPWGFTESGNRGCRRFISTSAQLYQEVTKCGTGVANKRIPEWIRWQSKDVIAKFLEGAILGDEWVQTNPNGTKFRSYATISKELADGIQELFIKLGNASNIKVRHTPEWSIDGRSGTNAKPQYHVTEITTRKSSLDGGGSGKRRFIGKKVKYSGRVYCVTVPNGTLICRRNGKSFIAGNCRVYALAMVYAYREALIQAHNLEDFPWSEFWEYLEQ